jgi:hypothetical protein
MYDPKIKSKVHNCFMFLGKIFLILDFKLSPCFECCMFSFGLFPSICSLNANVSEHCPFHLHRRVGTSYLPTYEDGTDRTTQKKTYDIFLIVTDVGNSVLAMEYIIKLLTFAE